MNIGRLFKRFWAYCFDSIIVCGIYLGILLLLEMLGMNIAIVEVLQRFYKDLSQGISADVLIGVLRQTYHYVLGFYLFYGLLFFIYEIIFLSSSLSATPGKLTLGLEVGCGNKVSFIKVFIRSLLKVIVTLASPLTFVFFLVSVFNPKRQSPHDMLASTYVINKQPPASGAAPHMTLEEFFEEMTSRGLRLYSEQKALAEEIYGRPIIGPDRTKISNASGALVGVLILVVSIFLSVSFISYSYWDIDNYEQDFRSHYTQNP